MATTSWDVRLADEFDEELKDLPHPVQEEILASAGLLEKYGPNLGRPWVDTLKGTRFPNLKEIRVSVSDKYGVWRVAFAFDPSRTAILLVAEDKSSTNTTRFYKRLIETAEERYQRHLGKS